MKCIITTSMVSILLLLSHTKAAEPLKWRNGYIDRWGKPRTPEWRPIKTENAANFVVDLKSVSPVGSSMRVVAYLVQDDEFDPHNLITLTIDCEARVTDVASNVRLEALTSVIEEARVLACH
ncbi:hypothetical protein [Bradyrhizobium neotropicale]|uniref:hypothetical protein n=1 Tax=Bradyrhizobium neotropicale TaxID=1497615 RepID=UPI001AD68727|nr:hypothetical protein [Bradyrhizobium neotropicale]MBO4226762.1 hypothetical protein [Bradyrhizobium neotropicale]